MKVELAGRVALVTGAAQGIGLSIADTLGRNGARVLYTDIDALAAQAASDKGAGAGGFALDVADAASIAAGVARVVR